MKYVKQILNIVLVTLISCTVSLQAQIFKNQRNNIDLTIVDYMDNQDAILYYKEGQVIRANDFMTKGAHPLCIMVVNNSDNFIEISPKSIFLAQYLISKDTNFILPVFLFCSVITIGVTGAYAWSDYKDFHPYGFFERAKRSVKFGMTVTLYSTIVSGLINLENSQLFMKEYILHKSMIIAPGEKIETFILLDSKSYKRLFNFRVFAKDTQDIAAVFDVDLRTA